MTSPDPERLDRPNSRRQRRRRAPRTPTGRQVVRQLHDALGRGLLSLDECDDRVAAAYAARFVEDLAPADRRPAARARRRAGTGAPGWRALLVLAWLQLRTTLAGISGEEVRRGPRRDRRRHGAGRALARGGRDG